MSVVLVDVPVGGADKGIVLGSTPGASGMALGHQAWLQAAWQHDAMGSRGLFLRETWKPASQHGPCRSAMA